MRAYTSVTGIAGGADRTGRSAVIVARSSSRRLLVDACERILLSSHRLVDDLLFRLKPVIEGAPLGTAIRLP
jgi:hypothetical protein